MDTKNKTEKLSKLIAAYEQELGINICINAFYGDFLQFVPSQNHYHNNLTCNYIKNLSPDMRQKCMGFDNVDIPHEINSNPQKGIWKCCHGEIMEYVCILEIDNLPAGKIFFGQFRKPDNISTPGIVYSKSRAIKLDARRPVVEKLTIINTERMHRLQTIFHHIAFSISHILSSLPVPSDCTNGRQEKIDNFTGRRLGARLTLNDIAVFLGLSPSRTGAVIRELYGMSFAELFQQRRIEYARELLKNTTLSAVKTAKLCGYEDTGYFHRCFKKTTGMTPMQYRKHAVNY